MSSVPLPNNEMERIQALRDLGILDSPPDSAIDCITRAAANFCETPIALVSLVDTNRQWFKACVGMSTRETKRECSFCTHAILNPDELLIVSDTFLDDRFKDNPLVTGEPKIRFYAGQPLVTSDGIALGTLCVIDQVSRTLSNSQTEALFQLANAVVALFEEQYRQEEALEQYRVFVESAPDASVILDQAGNIKIANSRVEMLFGYAPEEIIGLPVEVLVPDRFRARHVHHRAAFNTAPKAREMGSDIELLAVSKDGREFPIEVSLSPVNTSHEQLVAAAIRDITERKAIEQSLEVAEARFEMAATASHSGFWYWPDINQDAEWWSPQIYELLGYENGEIESSNSSLDSMVHPEDSQRIYETLDAHLKNHTPYDVEYRIKKKSGEYAWFREFGEVNCDDNGNPVSMAGSLLDINQKREHERILTTAKEVAESATKTKSRFLAAASHDLRQPLQAIGLYLSVLERHLENPDKVKELCEKAGNSLSVMGRLLDALLDISKLDAGSVSPEKRNVHVQEVLGSIVSSNRPHAEQKGLDFSCDCKEQTIYTDPALLERIVENFIVNAIRYTDQGHVSIDSIRVNDTLKISVSDSGVGIPPDEIDHVFEEYYQLDNSVRDRKKGLGLGLSIVKHIARLLDYPVEVSSMPGSGTTFSVIVPLAESDMERTNILTPPVIDEKKTPVVLFIDDDLDIVDATSELLETFDVELHTALDCQEALAKVAGGVVPDFLISDYRLPEYNGVELVQRIRGVLHKEVPTVIMTGDTSPQNIEQSNLQNCTVLHKPVDGSKLLEMIENLSPSTIN